MNRSTPGLPVHHQLPEFTQTHVHWYTCVPHPEPSSLLPPHTIPLDRPSALAPSIQYRASNLDWQLVSYMINAGEGVEKREPSYTVGGNAN